MLANQGLVHHNASITASHLSQFKNWAMVWMQSSQQTAPKQQKTIESIPSPLEKAILYQTTFQKLQPRTRYSILPLGGFIQMRKCLDTLEEEIFHEYSQTPSYVRPSKRLPFNPDKLSKRKAASPYKRRSFASSTLVYISSGSTVRVQPIQEDDDDVPLGKLVFSGSKNPSSQ